MAELKSVLMEAFAQALARGLPPGRAEKAAGYKKGAAKKKSERADVVERVAEIGRERAEALCDPAPVIARLMAMADAVAVDASPAALREIRGMLADAAALKETLANRMAKSEDDRSAREWVERYGPRS